MTEHVGKLMVTDVLLKQLLNISDDNVIIDIRRPYRQPLLSWEIFLAGEKMPAIKEGYCIPYVNDASGGVDWSTIKEGEGP